jgi:hypothetical protein
VTMQASVSRNVLIFNTQIWITGITAL